MATLTITTTAAHDARIVAAFGRQLGLGRDATVAEVKAAIIAYVVNVVRTNELRLAAIADAAANVPVAPT